MKKRKLPFDKYKYYFDSVQSPEEDIQFVKKVYKDLRGREAKIFREDFCGAFRLAEQWVKLSEKNVGYGLDIDPEPIEYGKKHYLPHLLPAEAKRLHVMKKNVLSSGLPKTDIICAFNFSYFCFKSRSILKKYLLNSYQSLRPKGILILDSFGGPLCHHPNEESRRIGAFTYYWDQKKYDPITHEAQYAIHFKPKNGRKYKNVFNYDWRMWGLAEVCDLVREVGFRKAHIYWEGTARDGGGSGSFYRREKGEECDAWVAYIVAEK